MRTLRLAGSRPESPCPEAGRPESRRSNGDPDLETGYDRPQAQDPDSLPPLPHRDPRRATDTDAEHAGCRIHGEQTTGEPCALKVASTVRRGADGKGRSRFSVMRWYDRPTNSGTRRTSPAAYPTDFPGDPRPGR